MSEETYRYLLTRRWDDPTGPNVLWIMLNPSTADETEDDPTIRKCVGFSKLWGCSALSVVNLFALRSTDPRKLYTAKNPVGPENNEWIRNVVKTASFVVIAWGARGSFMDRDYSVLSILKAAGVEVFCLGTTKSGEPKHPLYISYSTKPVKFPSQWRNP